MLGGSDPLHGQKSMYNLTAQNLVVSQYLWEIEDAQDLYRKWC